MIVGAGCAGLSLAARLADAGPRVGRVVVVDGRTSFARDRTWCFWNVHPHAFAAAATHRWARWRVTGPDGTDVVRTSTRYAYQHVPADAFYADALARIAAARHVELRLGERVLAIDDGPGDVCVHTDRSDLRAAHVFDSRVNAACAPRPQPGSHAGHGAPAARLVQAFVGVAVGTAASAFDPSTVTLMDFTAEWSGEGVGFGYVLPYTEREALIEIAVIADAVPAPGTLDAALARYVARMTRCAPHVVRWREAGAIPMDAGRVQRRPSPRVTRIGTAGGLVKPSTGYAFLAMQRDAARLADTLGLGRAPSPRGGVARWLDDVFLRRLRADWERAPALFTRLFADADPDALVRFLSDVASPTDVAHVVAALPPLPFAAEACRLAWSASGRRTRDRPPNPDERNAPRIARPVAEQRAVA